VYVMKSSEPRIEPWGTPEEKVCKEEWLLSQLTQTKQDDK